jgi:hypothetical protein
MPACPPPRERVPHTRPRRAASLDAPQSNFVNPRPSWMNDLNPRVPVKRSFPFATFLDALRQPLAARRQHALRVTDFPMLHSPFSTCASSIVTSSVKSCATPSSA